VLAWLTRRPRWTFHFTPTSASWLNAIENFFSKINANPKPFVWTKSAEAILAKLHRCPVPSV
jgi:hypothetical protein